VKAMWWRSRGLRFPFWPPAGWRCGPVFWSEIMTKLEELEQRIEALEKKLEEK